MLVLEHDTQPLVRPASTKMTFYQKTRQVNYAGPTGTGNPIPIAHEDFVGDDLEVWKLGSEFIAVEPVADASMSSTGCSTSPNFASAPVISKSFA